MSAIPAITAIRTPPPLTPTRILKGLRNSTPGMTPILCVPSCPLWFKGLSLPMSAIPYHPTPCPPASTQFHPRPPNPPKNRQRVARLANYQIPKTKVSLLNASFKRPWIIHTLRRCQSVAPRQKRIKCELGHFTKPCSGSVRLRTACPRPSTTQEIHGRTNLSSQTAS